MIAEAAPVLAGALVAVALVVAPSVGQAPAARRRRAGRVRWDPPARWVDRFAREGVEVVYIIRAGDTARVKVGTTTSWPARRGQLATGMLGYPIRVEAILPGGVELERALHRALAEHRVTGDREWFELAAGDRAWREAVEACAGRR